MAGIIALGGKSFSFNKSDVFSWNDTSHQKIYTMPAASETGEWGTQIVTNQLVDNGQPRSIYKPVNGENAHSKITQSRVRSQLLDYRDIHSFNF